MGKEIQLQPTDSLMAQGNRILCRCTFGNRAKEKILRKIINSASQSFSSIFGKILILSWSIFFFNMNEHCMLNSPFESRFRNPHLG